MPTVPAMEAPNRRHIIEFTAHAVLDDSNETEEASGTGSRTNDGNECSFPTIVHQRRRVNPESLALRLGPDLVRDLDALITPGNTEMPSFAVRKELQERYNIDRRHIYDYFHSRGLRVVKEDKHGNPMPAKDVPIPLPNLRTLRQVPIKYSRSHPSYPVAAERRLLKSRGVTKAKPGRPKKNPSVNPRTVAITRETDESTDTTPVSEDSPRAVPAPAYVSVNPLIPHDFHPIRVGEDENCTFNSAVNPLDESFSVRRAIGDIAYAYRHKSVFERMQELTEYPAKLALTDDRSLSWNDISPCSASGEGLFLPHAKSLTWDERHAIYETLSDSLGPAHGIQECQGTYRKHMEARRKLYFEGLVSVPYHHSQQPTRTGTLLLDRKPPLGTNEFRHWLSETRFLKRDGVNGSPRLHASHRNVNVAKQQDMDGINDKQHWQRSDHYRIQTLDELFSPLKDNLNFSDPTTDSPIVHTREVTRMTAHAHAQVVAHQSNARDQLPFSVTSTPSSPILPDTSVTEIQQTDRAQFHGLSGFPGPQEAETRMPAGEPDSHLQWQEHAPYIARSGRGAALSETKRRSRNMSNNARSRPPSSSPRRPPIRDLDRIRTRAVTSRDVRRRTPSAAGDI